MIELTEEQRQELASPEPVAIDPRTQETYVLVRKAVYERIKNLLYDDGEWSDAELRSRLAQSAAANGWNEPEMDDYDHYDAKRANNAREAR